MIPSINTYIPGTSLLHRGDARVKLVLLLAYSATLFFIRSWVGMGIAALIVLALIFSARLPLRRFMKVLLPLFFILGIVWVCNAFVWDVHAIPTVGGIASVSAGFATGMAPIALVGDFGLYPEGCIRGLFYVARIVLLVLASFVVTYTTTSNELSDAFISFLGPLRHLKVPVDDVAMVLSIALRFIPLTAEEFFRVRDAQVSRGAAYEGGSLWQRISSWQTVFIPLFVGMFRRADVLAEAMEARCYGAGARTSLSKHEVTPAQIGVLLVGLLLCVALGVFA